MLTSSLKIRCHFDYEDTWLKKKTICEYLADATGQSIHELGTKTNEELLALLNENDPDEFYYSHIAASPVCIRCEITPYD